MERKTKRGKGSRINGNNEYMKSQENKWKGERINKK